MNSRKSFLLRISPELYRELEAWAQQELRSVNGQIEYLLHQAVRRRKGEGPEEPSPGRHMDGPDETAENSPETG
jgi:hypothetical protein